MEQNTNEITNWRELFSLYSNLVEPFKEFEKRAYNKRTIELGASDARGTIDYGYIGIIREAFRHTVKWAILFLAVFWISGFIAYLANIKSLVAYYDSLSSELIWAIEDIIFEDGSWIFELVALVILYIPFPCLIFLFPLMIIRNAIHRTHVISKAKKTLKTCENALPQADALLQDAWNSIAPYVEKVPPNYRNSHALAFFSNSFFNFKVRNLQEAVNLYDDYLHKQRMEQSQREMLETQRESMNAINSLSGQMDYIHAQMDFMQDQISSLY